MLFLMKGVKQNKNCKPNSIEVNKIVRGKGTEQPIIKTTTLVSLEAQTLKEIAFYLIQRQNSFDWDSSL